MPSSRSIFKSSFPGRPEELPFTVTEFFAACTAARDSEDKTAPEDWQRLMAMYSQIRLLRIDLIAYFTPHIVDVPTSGLKLINSPLYNLFLSELSAPPLTHPFGLPFSSAEFVEVCKMSHALTLPEAFKRGVRHLVTAMIQDLGTHAINLRRFITGTEGTTFFSWIKQNHSPALQRAEILHTVFRCTSPSPPYTLNVSAFKDAFSAKTGIVPHVRDPRNLRVAMFPMSHLQAAVFVSGLEKTVMDEECACVWTTRDEDIERWVERQEHMEELVVLPCCGEKWAAECLITYLMERKARCRSCGEGWL
jgi:hypothetical protein